MTLALEPGNSSSLAMKELVCCRSYRTPGGMAKCACFWKIAILSG